MAVNDNIKFSDYNNIRSKVEGIMGAGSGNSGYGQSLVSAAVAEGNTVTINEWANLRYDIINARVHQTGSLPSPVAVAEGNTIRYSTVNAPVDTYDTLADTIISNKFTVGAGQFATNVPSAPSTRTASWNNSLSCTVQFYWANSNQARYFFNSGGQVRVTSSRSGGSSSQQNTAWTSLLSSSGTQSFGGNNPDTETSPATGTNWYRCTNSFQTYYSASSSSPYGSNSYQLQARTADVPSNASGTSASGEIRLVFTDGYVDPGNTGPNDFYAGDNPNTVDYVDGTLSVFVDLIYATGILYPIGFGNFTVTSPTVAISSITGS
jgi:hypothetical protein